MRIFLFGNLGSGKSTLADLLQQRLSGYPIFAIDDFRRGYGDGTLAGETEAVEHFVTACVDHEDCLVECSGFGPVAERLRGALGSSPVGIGFIVSRSEAECLAAAATKDYAATPYPAEYKAHETPADTIRRSHRLFTVENLGEIWAAQLWHLSLVTPQSPDSPPDLCLNHHLVVDRLRKWALADSRVGGLVAYGSTAGWRLTEHSDLDLFCLSDVPVSVLSRDLGTLFPDADQRDVLGNKVTVRWGELLLEVVCIETLDSVSAVYYSEAEVVFAESTMLKGDQPLLLELRSHMSPDQDVSQRVASHLAEAYFYLRSLPAVARKADPYKYYFHLNILLHRCVQLEMLLAGRQQHNYLPRQAVTQLEQFPWRLFEAVPTFIPEGRAALVGDYFGRLLERLCTAGLLPGSERERYRA